MSPIQKDAAPSKTGMDMAPRHHGDVGNVLPIVPGRAAKQNGSAASRLTGSDVSFRVADQDRFGQIESVTIGSLVQQARFGLAAVALVTVIVGTDEDVLDIRCLRAEQLAQSLVNLVERGL